MSESLKGNCEKCGTGYNITNHHLFNYHDTKNKLLQIYKKPVTDKEHNIFQKKITNMHKKVPTLMLCRDCHDEVETKVIKVRSIWQALSSSERKRIIKS